MHNLENIHGGGASPAMTIDGVSRPDRISTREAAPAREEYPFIETVRGFASIFVLLTHTRNWIFEVTTLAAANKLLLPFYFVTALGRESVIAFFVVSGFLVGGRVMVDVTEGRFAPIRYFASRFSRIGIAYFPALLLGLLIYEAIWRVDPVAAVSMGREFLNGSLPATPDLRSAACHLAMLQGLVCPYTETNPALWSLGYEWLLYVVAPVAIYAVAAIRAPAMRLLIVLWMVLGASALVLDPIPALVLIGVWFLSAASYRHFSHRETERIYAYAALAACCVLVVIGRLKIWHPYLPSALLGIGLAVAMSSRAVLMIDVLPRLSRFLASFSFSLYVTHYPVAFAVLFVMRQAGTALHPVPMGVRPMLDFVVLVCCCIAFAYAFSRLTEAHTARLRKWLLGAHTARAPREAM